MSAAVGRLRNGEKSRALEAQDVAPCAKCGAHSWQHCNRYRLQFPVICPRDAMPRNPGADPDRVYGMELCAEALRGNDQRFEPRQPLQIDHERYTELDFHGREDER